MDNILIYSSIPPPSINTLHETKDSSEKNNILKYYILYIILNIFIELFLKHKYLFSYQ